ncbi:hypothetical protein [Pseudoxanthomonas indica]|uniref:Uncharacterized protein n=1 Tax=Pseudoxanthomonas indica TaxID=428993 RepID=A0A1T5IJY7_9GAMM|nr:hypothetical protein [Pseudoxanthomonas indica]GGD52532.1 hypothetical protein GCM10007235_25930 [Pseudoxanthomonas indica]SKC39313.1 hypothetical protein SAMN06296058_0009 [Pseudoxanthomonas indica]
MRHLVTKSKSRVSALVAGLTAMALAPMAFAGGGGGSGALSTITGLFDEYGAEAVAATIAFIVVLWTLRATGLLKPKT